KQPATCSPPSRLLWTSPPMPPRPRTWRCPRCVVAGQSLPTAARRCARSTRRSRSLRFPDRPLRPARGGLGAPPSPHGWPSPACDDLFVGYVVTLEPDVERPADTAGTAGIDDHAFRGGVARDGLVR